MSVVVRGVKNAFRGGVRPVAVILILAISMGLALAMLLANEAVKDRLEVVKQNAGTTVRLTPAGAQPMQGGGEPLYSNELEKLNQLDHVVSVDMALNLTLNTEGNVSATMVMRGSVGLEQGETSLESPIDPGTLGHRNFGGGQELPDDFKLPIRMVGVNGERTDQGQEITIIEGSSLADAGSHDAIVGVDLAEKNGLSVGSTFQAYGETFTVAGIFDLETLHENAGIYIPLVTAQRLGEAGTEVSTAAATIDSIDNVASSVESIREAMDGAADVTPTNESAQMAVESLQAVERVSIVGFVIALAAAGVIIFLTMLMIVRERRREIGVLKAIGGGNGKIVSQFVVEAVVLVAVSAVVGMGVAAVSSNGIANALVNTNTVEVAGPAPVTSQGAGGFRSVTGGSDTGSPADLIGNVTTNVSASMLGYGALAALAIAIVGSAIPAWLVTKVRPAEVLRGE